MAGGEKNECMTEQEKLSEETKLIAGYLGLPITTKRTKFSGGEETVPINYGFHDDWSWQMNIVEEIEKGNYGFKMCRKVVEVYFDDTKEVILKAKEKSRQESLYKAIVEFIKWYNKQKN